MYIKKFIKKVKLKDIQLKASLIGISIILFVFM